MTPSDDSRDEELLARYRRASADAAAPSDAVRAAIIAESRRVADELARRARQPAFDASRPAANDSRWKIPVFGTVGAALLAALLFAPRYWENTPALQEKAAPAAAPASTASGQAQLQSQAKDEVPKLTEVKPNAAPSFTAPTRQSPGESSSLQEIVVTQANRKKAYAAAAPIAATPAPAAPPSVAQNYAPAAASASPLAAAQPTAGARLKARDSSSRAAESNSIAASADLVGRFSAQKPATLESAIAQGDVARASALLDQGAVIDARDEAGRTPLMLAVTHDKVELVRLLLARGADPNAADNAGHTPLQQATKRNLQDVAELLEQAGAH